MLNENTVLIKNPEKSSRKYLKSTIIEPDITLNEVASDIYDLIDDNKDINEICKEFMNIYDVDYDTCYKDLTALIDQLIEQDIIRSK
ncbi:PqqD family protein [Bacillus thuringiensis]|uniref:PqqD family protein n=1 Tax=Bacillus thuringiensis TaxID=1428 RepID=UPI000BF584B0|nr:PqqD family protein [Bacillus thuringiensis]PEW37832.1 PqqD family protein [Bacillus thuringiensis]PEY66278.1 PqqD family protein [Bacillus thuringiensis]PFA08024.1 PqqD family protein [Bacillus thuringiensis]PFK10527.1 PqqD family protein [Bacillus thuringiensis]PFM26003.1 PqqD family protein [Bacillus thuringiensis]